MSLLSVKSIYQEVFDVVQPLYGKREAGSIAAAYLFDKWHVDRIKLSMNIELAIEDRILKSDLRKLEQGMPLQHVVGFQEFYGHKFITNHHALIPRPETEELVEWVIETINEGHPEIESQEINLLDIGTGTGCIPSSIDLALSNVACHGLDISEEALKLADTNAKRLGANVDFQLLDILSEDLDADKYEFIVSNPPYIPDRDKAHMHRNVLEFEPNLALFVPNNDPLIFYQSIAQKGFNALQEKGQLFFEIHESFGDEVIKLLSDVGYANIELRKDINGKDRMIKAIKK